MNYLNLVVAKIDADIPKIPLNALVTNVLNIIYFVVGSIAVVMIILAGYNYLTANGDPGKASKGLRTILYATIGLVVVIFAFAITNFVVGRV
jgi:hypothetical protein